MLAAPGTLDLLAHTAQLMLGSNGQTIRSSGAGLLCSCWSTATALAYPLTGTHRCWPTVWGEVPALRCGLPAIAGLLHWCLQQPEASPCAAIKETDVGIVLLQLEYLVRFTWQQQLGVAPACSCW